ncbi:hypothetical protein OGAPHI_003019 [Ogataea philodendri]|uniref:Uncharacterized protein n=1 Tax=Ogataea philodendri TaxID=1378263 RepID=A0A9P8T6R3_9ASCO|nr:uncharacterized protein OGAPHI_003019 [Ogataea philodendri]KAH3667370.1 hypothetical protein OGAPHI_003019 [Ogataea philodendri]
MVESVRAMSLSIDPTSPTIVRYWYLARCSVEISPVATSSSSKDGHSLRKRSAPVKEPSPPQTTKASIPSTIMFLAALSRPHLSLNSMHRAVPIRVPPRDSQPRTSSQSSFFNNDPPWTSPE